MTLREQLREFIAEWRQDAPDLNAELIVLEFCNQAEEILDATEPDPERAVRVRVAVAVNEDGDWTADGAEGKPDDEAAEFAEGCLPDTSQRVRTTWLSGWAMLPEAVVEVEADE